MCVHENQNTLVFFVSRNGREKMKIKKPVAKLYIFINSYTMIERLEIGKINFIKNDYTESRVRDGVFYIN